jgi:hypothetical protein
MVGTSKELYEETVASQIKVWDDEIEHLDARADILMAQIEDRYYNLIRSLRTKEKELNNQLVTLRAVNEGDVAWLEVRDCLAHATDEMKAALCRAAELIEPEVER